MKWIRDMETGKELRVDEEGDSLFLIFFFNFLEWLFRER